MPLLFNTSEIIDRIEDVSQIDTQSKFQCGKLSGYVYFYGLPPLFTQSLYIF